ncbi:MAG TPA: LacI family DNA-binding transcriptional regulator [Verrucomicrobiae bacterium]|jgi:LacI family transcriptional regulator|nr:LacI family DNA-binding transcriptional regulator [Verrucomicrobiae bacterium]
MVTQAQIARKLGVSRQLVTFALSGYPQISQESRERILAAAQAMGYRPNPYARALRKGKSGIIGLWIPDQISTHYTHVARELNRLVKTARHELIVSEVSIAEEQQMLSHVPMDGIFVVDAPDQADIYRKSPTAARVPIISMGADCCENSDAVQVDLYAGALEVMEHLIGSGFRRIAHATFVREDSSRAVRRLGYVKAMRQAKLKPEFIYYPLTEQQRTIARQLIQDYIRENGRPDAIFCHSDDVALGIYRGLCDMKIKVPEEIALVGCDGIQDTEYLECPLTTLVQPVAAMCATAWQFLIQRMDQSTTKTQKTKLKPKLVIRNSSVRENRGAASVSL